MTEAKSRPTPQQGGSQDQHHDHPTLSLYISPTPYRDGLPYYLRAGWPGVIPLNKAKKTPAVKGVTGRHDLEGNPSHWPTTEEYDKWADLKAKCNLGLRLPEIVLGLDCDDYDGKHGGATLAKLEAELGPLPATWRSTSRRDGSRSGIYLFRVPEGLAWPGVVEHSGTSDIETVHAGLRTVAAWPSIHPKVGTVYGWITPEGEQADRVPRPDELPDLATTWIEYVTGGRRRDDTAPAAVDLGEAAGWLTAGDPCGAVLRVLGQYTGSSRHDTARTSQVKFLRLGEQGHQGVAAAMDRLREMFVADVTEPDRDGAKEWADMLAGAPKEIVKRTAPEDKRCCDDAPPVMNIAQLAAKFGKTMPWEDVDQDQDQGEEEDQDQDEPKPKPAPTTTGDGVPPGLVPHPWKPGAYTTPELAEQARQEGDPSIHEDGRRRIMVDVSAHLAESLRKAFGYGELAGIFGRGGELVFTPRLGAMPLG